jgi:hypothetical protein
LIMYSITKILWIAGKREDRMGIGMKKKERK